jgi:hypothetical protein
LTPELGEDLLGVLGSDEGTTALVLAVTRRACRTGIIRCLKLCVAPEVFAALQATTALTDTA